MSRSTFVVIHQDWSISERDLIPVGGENLVDLGPGAARLCSTGPDHSASLLQ